ncbi:PAS domain-containing sensor histidine kinase [soil metagenome]
MEGSNGRVARMGDDRYRLLVEAITDYAVYMLDVNGIVTSWNPGAQRFKGYHPDEIIGHHFSRFYTAAEQQKGTPSRALREAAETGRFEQEGWRVRKDGSEFWAHVVIDPIRTAAGELIGFAKITRDLTERKAAQETLRRSEEQFRLLVDGVTDYAIYMLDAEGRVTNWNAGAQRIKGYRPDEIIGRHFSIFYTEEDRAAGDPAAALATAAARGNFEKEGWRVRKDGSRFMAHVVIDAIRDQAGEIIGFAKITRDVTERNETQKSLEQAREALFQAQKMEAIGQLTGGIAHDFNNLLAAVIGSLELVHKRVPYDPRVTPLLENAMQGAQRGAVLTQRMLAFARKQELKLEPVDVASLVRGMMDFLGRTLGPTIDVVLRFPTDLPRVQTDPAQLESALMNLAVNARDAMPGGGTITVTAIRDAHPDREDAQGFVRLTVADTGHGMDAATLARAADPFFTTKGVGKGTGLGLSMVHGLAAQSGGRLELRSTVGVGSAFELWLPVAPFGATAAVAAGHSAMPGHSRRLVILAVDDDSLVLTNTAAMLDDLGHEVLSAPSAQEGLALLHARPDIDLVLCDEVMPHMTGSEFAVVVDQLRPGLPFVIASGYADLAETDESRYAPPKLTKPFSQADLAAQVSRALDVPAPTG